MGQIVFWMEVVITSALIFALVMALLARIRWLLWRQVLVMLALLIVILSWVIIVGSFVAVQYFFGGADLPLVSSAFFGAMLLISTVVVWLRARRPSQLTEGLSSAARWRLGRLALISLAGVLLTSTTFWNLDLAARQEMASLRTEAGAIALNVCPPRIPDSQNAAILYRQAWEMLDAEYPGRDANSWNHMVGEWMEYESGKFNPNNKEILAFLEKNKAIISILHQAGQMPGCNFGTEYNAPSVNLILPEFNKIRDLARLLSLSARVNATGNRLNEAMEDLSAEYAVANHCIDEPPLIALLVGISIEAQAFSDLEYILDRTSPTTEAMSELKLSPSITFAGAFQRSMRMEEAFMLSIFSEISEKGNFSLDPDIFCSGTGNILATPYRVFLMSADVRSFRGQMQRFKELSGQPYYEAIGKWKDLVKGFNNRNKRMGGLLTSYLFPSFGAVAEYVARADAQYRLVLLADASVRYRLKNGAWPEKLDNLSPQYIFTVPVDPFTGKGMKIARKDKQFILYSVGPDLVDDGGKLLSLDMKMKKGDIAITLKDFPPAK